MKFAAVLLCSILVAGLGNCNEAQAQVVFNPQGMTVTPVNGGTGTIVSVPLPGGAGLAVSVATGSAALPLENIAGTTNATRLMLGDDSGAHVPLGFAFPFYGQSFTNSWMYSNGLVSFSNSNVPGAGCCGGLDLTTLRDSQYNYMIAPLWTDLIDTTGSATWYKGGATSMTYGWYGTKEYGTNNSNTFELNVDYNGGIKVKYGGAFVSSSHTVTAGMTGNLANGEYFQYYHGQGFSAPTTGLSWSANGTAPVDPCTINPLSSPSCSGYQAAYTTQQCTISALWNPSCPNYATAYFSQQCSITALYDPSCPGYQAAYTTEQCSLNPLYSTSCAGYQIAYHDQQCSLNSLYATDCAGYAAAYLQQQCDLNPLYSTTCRGYEQAYHDQQCTINPLYATDCSGYAVAFHDQQCSISPLYASDCLGYREAYFDQQCSLNGLYDKACPNYATAYATKMLLEQQNMASTVATAGVIAQTAPVAATTTTTTTTETPTSTTTSVKSDGSVSSPAAVSSTGNSTVDKVITINTTTANSSAAPAAPVQLVQAAPPAASPTAPAPQANDKPSGGDKPSGDKPAAPTQVAQSDSGSGEKAKPTARQEIAAKRADAERKEASAKAKEASAEMGKASNMEAQKQMQTVVMQAMSYTPGFDVYSKQLIVQTEFYKPFTVYKGQVNVDNRANQRMFGGTDRLHNEMVDEQYNRK